MTKPLLLAPGAGTGFLGRLAVPAELYWVAREPAPLAGMSYPHRADWDVLYEAGFRHVVCLTDDEARYDPSPLDVTAFGLQDLLTRPAPDDPVRERELVLRASAGVVELVSRGEGVLVHCHAGRGRTGTVIGCTLVLMGHDPEEVVDYLHRVQRTRNKAGWPEDPWQAHTVRTCLRSDP